MIERNRNKKRTKETKEKILKMGEKRMIKSK